MGDLVIVWCVNMCVSVGSGCRWSAGCMAGACCSNGMPNPDPSSQLIQHDTMVVRVPGHSIHNIQVQRCNIRKAPMTHLLPRGQPVAAWWQKGVPHSMQRADWVWHRSARASGATWGRRGGTRHVSTLTNNTTWYCAYHKSPHQGTAPPTHLCVHLLPVLEALSLGPVWQWPALV